MIYSRARGSVRPRTDSDFGLGGTDISAELSGRLVNDSDAQLQAAGPGSGLTEPRLTASGTVALTRTVGPVGPYIGPGPTVHYSIL